MSQPRRNAFGRCELSGVDEVGLLVGPINEKRTDRRFDGYLDKEATEKKILRDVFSPGDKYFNSCDLLTRDKHGFFYWSDRTGDTFRWKGENVATSQVASTIIEGDDVLECCVYGVEVPGSDGRCGMASLVLCTHVSVEDFDFAGLLKRQQKNLPSQAIVRFIRISRELTKTETMKYKKDVMAKEGWSSTDPTFVLTTNGYYENLTPALKHSLLSGTLRL
jgi:fatty-acyl-CoA synthase